MGTETATDLNFSPDPTIVAQTRPPKPHIKYEVLLDFVGGCFGGIAGVVVGHPFDTVKVRLQTQALSGCGKLNPAARPTVNPAINYATVGKKFPIGSVNPEVVPPHLYKGTWNCLSSIVREEGVLGLYKGLASPLAGLAFINAIIFGVQANVMRLMGASDDSIRSHMVAGSSAGAVQSLVACPTELAKVRMQLQGQGESHRYYKTHTHAYRGSFDCLYKIFKKEGLTGCYRGMNTTLIRDVPGFTVYFGMYNFLCSCLQARKPGQDLGVSDYLLAGGLGGTCSWIVSHPVDVIKSRLQADGVSGKSKYRGFLHCCRLSIASEGYRVFLNGLTANLLRAFVVNAATFLVYEYFMRYCRIYGQPQ
ncbi:mitochondrial basic amino acids transporter-like [Ptychodera flava]|uniref:mitochondrial basic amino acids transporter-like n=1 Tax=Ptychodera flava TaxID=63121 RepID=UPI00396A06B7